MITFLRRVTHMWHAYYFTCFDYALKLWPGNEQLLIMYAKGLAFFPQHSRLLMKATIRLTKIEPRSPGLLSLLRQIRSLLRERQRVTTPIMLKNINEIQSKVAVLSIYIKRFWENILHQDVQTFWDDSRYIVKSIKEIDGILASLCVEYPNSLDLLHAYHDFASHVTRDRVQISQIHRSINTLYSTGRTHIDSGVVAGILTYPNIAPLVVNIKTENPQVIEQQFEAPDMTTTATTKDQHVSFAIKELTQNSRLGQVRVTIILMVLMTIVDIVLFWLYSDNFTSKYIMLERRVVETIQKRNQLIYQSNLFSIQFITFLLAKESMLTEADMALIAPDFWPEGVLDSWNTDIDVVYQTAQTIQEMFENLADILISLRDFDTSADVMFGMLFVGDETNPTIQSRFLEMFDYIQSISTISSPFTSPEFQRFLEIYWSSFELLFKMSSDVSDQQNTRTNTLFVKLKAYFILAIIFDLLLVTLPFLLQLFKFQIQLNAIAQSFTYFPNAEIRAIIRSFSTEEENEDDDFTHIAAISHFSGTQLYSNLTLVLTFLGSFLPVLVCGIVIHYVALSFQTQSSLACEQMSTLYTPLSLTKTVTVGMANIWLMDDNLVPSTDRAELLEHLQHIIDVSINDTRDGMWSDDGTYALYISHENEINLSLLPDANPEIYKSGFERMTTVNIGEAIDLESAQILYLLSHSAKSPITSQLNMLLQQIYWTSLFSPSHRELLFFEAVEGEIYENLSSYATTGYAMFYVVIALQLLATAISIVFMLNTHFDIRNAMMYYHFLPAKAVMSIHAVTTLLEKGESPEDPNQQGFTHTDFILSQIDQAVVYTDTNLVIEDFNDSWLKMLGRGSKMVKGQPITALLKGTPDKTFGQFLEKVQQFVKGHPNTRVSKAVTVMIDQNKKYLFCDAIMVSDGADTVDGIAFVIDDETRERELLELIKESQHHTERLLSVITPPEIVRELMSGKEEIAFHVQNLVVANIFISSVQFGDDSIVEALKMYDVAFRQFDEEIANFPQLTKIREFSKEYTFVGGLFSKDTRMETAAVEAINFALRITQNIVQSGTSLNMKIGIHTGGPLVCGVLSPDMPALQVIGPAFYDAIKLRFTCQVNRIQISRAIYELIYSVGYNIVERGEIELESGPMQAYYVSSN